MKLKRIILNVALALALVLVSAPAVSGHTYAAAAKAGAKTAAKGGAKKPPKKGGGGGGAAAPTACPADTTSKGQVLQGLGQTGSDCSDTQVNSTLQTAVTILSYIVGVASVIVIVIAGFKYIISGGEQGKVANAKNTLIYALVGLAVAALAQVMIHFVLFQTGKV